MPEIDQIIFSLHVCAPMFELPSHDRITMIETRDVDPEGKNEEKGRVQPTKFLEFVS